MDDAARRPARHLPFHFSNLGVRVLPLMDTFTIYSTIVFRFPRYIGTRFENSSCVNFGKFSKRKILINFVEHVRLGIHLGEYRETRRVSRATTVLLALLCPLVESQTVNRNGRARGR